MASENLTVKPYHLTPVETQNGFCSGSQHSHPLGSPEALHAFVDATSAECLQPVHLGLDGVNHNVEVHAVLARFGFGYPLKQKGDAVPSLGTSTARFASM